MAWNLKLCGYKFAKEEKSQCSNLFQSDANRQGYEVTNLLSMQVQSFWKPSQGIPLEHSC